MNTTIQIKDLCFEPFIGVYEINSRLQDIATQINNNYKDTTEDDPLIIIGILNGSFMFLSDLVKHITIKCEIHFIKVSSYVGTETSGQITKLIGLDRNINNKRILIVEDIIDTGLTMVNILKEMKLLNPRDIEICTFFHKKIKCTEELNIKYVGKEIEDVFVIGYGLDYDKLGRNHKCVYALI